MELYEFQQRIVERARESWQTGHKKPCIVLPCGAGKSVIAAEYAKKTTLNGKRVLFIVHRKELCDQIENTFRWWGVNMELCHIAMVQTVTRHLDTEPKPALIVTDEAHHAKANSYTRIFDYWPNVHMIGLTATPERLDGKGLGDIFDDLLVGETPGWLIEHGYLSPERYFTYDLIKAGKIRNGDFAAEDVKIDAAQMENVVRTYLDKAEGMKAVCYMPTVVRSEEMAEAFCRFGISAEHMDGTTPKDERTAIVERFRTGETQILCNVELVSEGFDVPDCGCSILCRPTQSLTLYIQQSMRCMRYAQGKTAIVLDFVNNVNRHGLPEDAREWTLADKPKRKKGEALQMPVITCPQCPTTFRMIQGKCPDCGWTWERKDKETLHLMLDLDEVKAKPEPIVIMREEDCKCYADYVKYAKWRGYKIGWARYKAKAKGMWTPY